MLGVVQVIPTCASHVREAQETRLYQGGQNQGVHVTGLSYPSTHRASRVVPVT